MATRKPRDVTYRRTGSAGITGLLRQQMARDVLAWLQMHMGAMQDIANSRTGLIEYRFGDEATLRRHEAWPKEARDTLRLYRNRFAHSEYIEVNEDGTTTLYKKEG